MSTQPIFTSVPKPVPDLNEIRRACKVIISGAKQGRVVEVRALKTPYGTCSGYYTDTTIVQGVYDLSSDESVPNVYWTIQELKRDLAAGAVNIIHKNVITTTNDDGVERYLYIPFDCDPKRPAGTSSTETEKAYSHDVACEIRDFLSINYGIESILADSGNGYHVLIRVDMAVSDATVELVKKLLAALNAKFGTERVDVDTTVYNPSRILKVYGSVARKGEHTDERPWRTSGLVEIPTELPVVSEETLRALLAEITASLPAEKAAGVKRGNVPADPNSKDLINDYRNKTLTSIAGTYREKGLNEEEIHAVLTRINEERCDPMLPDHEIDSISKSVARYKAGDPVRDSPASIIINSTPNPLAGVAQVPAAAGRPDWVNNILDAEEKDARGETGAHPFYNMTAEEIAVQREQEFPLYRLYPVSGPDFPEEHYYGVLGEISKIMCQFSEAHRATVYLNLIVSVGNMTGRGGYFTVDGNKNYTNEFLVSVGDSAITRKGLAAGIVNNLLVILDHPWFDTRNCKGFGSPQAVLAEIKDDSTFQRFNKATKTYDTFTQPGISDKRLCIREGEVSNIFKLMSDPKTRAAELIRDLWDSVKSSNRVAGKTGDGEHNSLICEKPHVSIVGTSTVSLVKSTLPVGAATTGDGNRFIWNYMKRTQLAPHGGPTIDWAAQTYQFRGQELNLIDHLLSAIGGGKMGKLIPIAKHARKTWDCLYERLEADASQTGYVAGMTARAAAHIRRLAMILCLMDRLDEIDKKHLAAAEAIWDYSQDSVRYIFTGYDLDQMKIIRAAENAGVNGITATDIHKLFSRKKTGEWVMIQLAELTSKGFLTKTAESRQTGALIQSVDVYKFKTWKRGNA